MANDNSAPGSIPLRVLILKYKYICAKVNDLFMVACQFEKKNWFFSCPLASVT